MNCILTTQECKVLYNYGKTHNQVVFFHCRWLFNLTVHLKILEDMHLLHLKNVSFYWTCNVEKNSKTKHVPAWWGQSLSTEGGVKATSAEKGMHRSHDARQNKITISKMILEQHLFYLYFSAVVFPPCNYYTKLWIFNKIPQLK